MTAESEFIEGGLVSRHRPSAAQHQGNRVLGIILIVMTVIFLLAGLGFYFGLGDFIFLPLCLLPAAAMAVLGYFYGLPSIDRYGELGIDLYKDGLVYTGRKGALQLVRFADVRQLWLSVVSNMAKRIDEYEFRFVQQNAAEVHLKLNSHMLEGLADVAEFALEAVRDRQMPGFEEAWQQGDTVIFGPLGVSQTGFEYKERSLAWGDVASVDLTNVDVRVMQRDEKKPWAQVNFAHIPNIAAFWEFVRRNLGGKALTVAKLTSAFNPYDRR